MTLVRWDQASQNLRNQLSKKNYPYLLSVIVTGVYCMCICNRTDVCDESLISLMDMPLMLAADAPSDGASLSDRTTIATERNSNFSMLQREDHLELKISLGIA